MKGRFFFSLNFISNHSDVCMIENIYSMETLINRHYPKELTEIISTNDWYNLAPNLSFFDFLNNNISDAQLRTAIINETCKFFGKYINDEFHNELAIHHALMKSDDQYYYSIINDLDTSDSLHGCNIIKKISDYHTVHENYLFLSPSSNESYASRCIELFDKILFSDDFPTSLSTLGDGYGILGFAELITKAISTLNNLDPEIRDIHQAMHWIHEKSGFECSVQGKNKEHLMSTVRLDDGSTQQVNCEFHIKVITRDDGGKTKIHSRVYFGLMPQGQKKHCFLLHCGEHL